MDFLATGGDYFWAPRTDFVALGTLDEILVSYLAEHSPVSVSVEDRIVATSETEQNPSGTNSNSTSSSGSGSASGGSEVNMMISGLAVVVSFGAAVMSLVV